MNHTHVRSEAYRTEYVHSRGYRNEWIVLIEAINGDRSTPRLLQPRRLSSSLYVGRTPVSGLAMHEL